MLHRFNAQSHYSLFILTSIALSFYTIIYVFFQALANESAFIINVMHYQSTYHETKQFKAYDIESLVGDVGGYMGLFLGYSILHLPNLVVGVKDYLQKIILKIKAHQRIDSHELLV